MGPVFPTSVSFPASGPSSSGSHRSGRLPVTPLALEGQGVDLDWHRGYGLRGMGLGRGPGGTGLGLSLEEPGVSFGARARRRRTMVWLLLIVAIGSFFREQLGPLVAGLNVSELLDPVRTALFEEGEVTFTVLDELPGDASPPQTLEVEPLRLSSEVVNSLSLLPSEVDALEAASQRFTAGRLHPNDLALMVSFESRWNPQAVNPAFNKQGLMPIVNFLPPGSADSVEDQLRVIGDRLALISGSNGTVGGIAPDYMADLPTLRRAALYAKMLNPQLFLATQNPEELRSLVMVTGGQEEVLAAYSGITVGDLEQWLINEHTRLGWPETPSVDLPASGVAPVITPQPGAGPDHGASTGEPTLVPTSPLLPSEGGPRQSYTIANPEPVSIVLAGDSISSVTEVGNYSYADQLPTKLAFLGMTSNELRVTAQKNSTVSSAFAHEDVSAMVKGANRDNVLVLCVGTNDIHNEANADTTFLFLKQLAERYQAQGWDVMIMTQIQLGGRNEVPGEDERRLALNNMIRNETNPPWVQVIDVAAMPEFSDSNDAVTANTAIYSRDGVHPTKVGYGLLADAVAAAIDDWVSRVGP